MFTRSIQNEFPQTQIKINQFIGMDFFPHIFSNFRLADFSDSFYICISKTDIYIFFAFNNILN